MYMSFFRGRWDELVEDADRFMAECELSPHYLESGVRSLRAYIRFARGDHARSFDDWDRSLAKAREIKIPQALLPALLQSAQGIRASRPRGGGS